ncbi:hypothetical protein PC9H_002647 [Pleurotus ostreatus]|uniref:Uncharacterized protein n=1 Tax=Pleurotus ostreatus TaxID=5322 RepID=A0A8H7DLW1_PLEOS|nr:uncharacterized protein PC9H_002647 [Pleurotus ostreatus]KAF7416382.1 hypothetical protein PC9H_002647 [Pleurotus ostreatus]KAJ8689286.1 hypothetical protein PTI98_013322 [Pleurotus ostreatus]
MAMMMANPQQPHTSSGFQYAPPAPSPQEPQLPEKNNVEMTRDMLIQVLEYFSTIVPAYFDNRPVRLVIHGGACMLLHPRLFPLTQSPMSQSLFVGNDGMPIPIPVKRTATRDVDYINRSFAAEWKSVGVVDATERLKKCIRATARQFGLGADWMNSDADIALPMATNPQTGTVYDPIYTDSLRPNNLHLHTIFTSQNQKLVLISVTPFWAVALKLVRYCKWDPGDICALLRNGTIMSKVTWNAEILEAWLHKECWPMGYASYDTAKVMEMRKRIQHAVQMVNAWNTSDPPPSSSPYPPPAPSSSYGPSPASSSRLAPEAWSMGGQGADPASPPVNGAWSRSPPSSGSAGQMPPPWGAAGSPPPPVLSHQPSLQWNTPPSTLGRSSARDSWVGGWALPVQNTGSSSHSSLHLSASMTFPGAPRSGQEANAPGAGVPAASNNGASQSSTLGLTLGREPSWDQRRAVDSASSVAVVSAYDAARRRQWDNDAHSMRSEASEKWRYSYSRDTADASMLQSSQSAPVIPTSFEYGVNASNDAYSQSSRQMKPRTKSGDDAGGRLATHVAEGDAPSFSGLPLGFVADEERKSQWDWYGLTDAEKEMIIAERRRKAAASASLRGGEYLHQQEPEPAPVIPFDTLLEKPSPPQARGFLNVSREPAELRHRKSMSSLGQEPDYAEAWHPLAAEVGARARERALAKLRAASPSSRPQANDEDLWRPFHGRGVAADNLRQSQSLGMI